MFDAILDLFSGGAHSKKVAHNKLMAEFKKDYVDSFAFVNRFPRFMVEEITLSISSLYESVDSKSSRSGQLESYQILGGLRDLYLFLWLEETGYGEKLAIKSSELICEDDYGDIDLGPWNKELNRFISERLYKMDAYLSDMIPTKYKEYARILGYEYFLRLNLDDPNNSKRDLIDDLNFTLSDHIDRYLLDSD